MGQRDAFSTQDVTKINQMYKCPNVGAPVTEAKPPMNSHNNINELIGETEEITTTTIQTSTGRPSAPQRPNRPFLNLVGNLISNAINQGK